jgi:hypothetical protein
VEPQKAGRVLSHQNAKGVGEGKGSPKFPLLLLTLSAAIRRFSRVGETLLGCFCNGESSGIVVGAVKAFANPIHRNNCVKPQRLKRNRCLQHYAGDCGRE